MNQRTYPRQVWVLSPSFKPKEVTVTKKYPSYSGADYGDITETGKRYVVEDMFLSEGEAIKTGWAFITNQEAAITKRLQTIAKKRFALAKATQDTKP